MSEVVLRIRHCCSCGAVFCICSHCDRGQRYCSQSCRMEARQQQLRAARRRYQRAEPGRRAHRMRQRRYRLRRAKACVTDQASQSIVSPGSAKRNGFGNCAVCGVYSHWIDPFPAIPPKFGYPRRRRVVGRSSKNYVFR